MKVVMDTQSSIVLSHICTCSQDLSGDVSLGSLLVFL